jgi:hypothetical protein
MTAALVMAAQAQAALNFSFQTEQWQARFGDPSLPGDFVTLVPAPGTVDLSSGPVDVKINTLDFLAQASDYGSPTYTVNIAQVMHLSYNSAVNNQLLQSGTLAISSSDILNLQGGAATSFVFPGLGTVKVTPLALVTQPNGGGHAYYDHMARFEFTPVPEPSTVIAGALLLLPFGASAIRVLRRK